MTRLFGILVFIVLFWVVAVLLVAPWCLGVLWFFYGDSGDPAVSPSRDNPRRHPEARPVRMGMPEVWCGREGRYTQ
jgi:hypothetical protein